MRVPEPRPGHPTRSALGGVLILAKDKPLSGTRLMARTLGGRTGRRPNVDNRRRSWNSRPDRLLDTSACDSVRNQSSPYGHGIKGRGIRAGDTYYQGTLIFCFRLAPMTSIPPAHLSVLSVGVGVSVINGFGSTVRMVAWSGPGLQAVRREDG